MITTLDDQYESLDDQYESSVIVRARYLPSSSPSGSTPSPTPSPHISFFYVEGNSGIWQNERVDQLAKQTLRPAKIVQENADISASTSFARLYRSATLNYVFSTRVPRKTLFTDKNSLLPSLGCFPLILIQDAFDCGYTMCRRV